tara:strand:+ start:245 stop:520 length:276 start_codon:yes stop_codon:yes gene_type:complete
LHLESFYRVDSRWLQLILCASITNDPDQSASIIGVSVTSGFVNPTCHVLDLTPQPNRFVQTLDNLSIEARAIETRAIEARVIEARVIEAIE